MDGLIYVVGGGDGKDWLCSAEVELTLVSQLENSDIPAGIRPQEECVAFHR